MKYFISCLLIFYAPTMLFAKPSFDCSKATTSVEIEICNDEILSEQDVLLSETYTAAKNTGAISSSEQRAWIQSRESCGSDFGCIYNSTRTRIVALLNSLVNDYVRLYFGDDPDDNQIESGIQILGWCENYNSRLTYECVNGATIGFSTCQLGHVAEDVIENIGLPISNSLDRICEISRTFEITSYSHFDENNSHIFNIEVEEHYGEMHAQILDGISFKNFTPKSVTTNTADGGGIIGAFIRGAVDILTGGNSNSSSGYKISRNDAESQAIEYCEDYWTKTNMVEDIFGGSPDYSYCVIDYCYENNGSWYCEADPK